MTIRTRPSSKEYREGWDRAFRVKDPRWANDYRRMVQAALRPTGKGPLEKFVTKRETITLESGRTATMTTYGGEHQKPKRKR